MLRFLYYLALTFLVLAQLTSLSKAEGANLYLFDIFVALSGLVFLVYSLGIAKKFRVQLTHLLLIVFLMVGTVSLLVSGHKYDVSEVLFSGFYLVRFFAYLLFSLGVYNLVLLEKLDSGEVKRSIIASGVLLVILGLLQLFVLPDFEELDPSLGWDPHKNRLASTFFDPNFIGAYLVSCLAILVETVRNSKRLGLTFWLILGSLLLGIVLTFSRSTWLMLGFLVLVYGIFKYRYLLLVALLIAFTAYYSVPRIQTRLSGTTDPADSAQFRWISWTNTLEIIKDQPLLGVGFNTLRYVQKDYGFTDEDTFLKHSASGSDSSLLFVWATTGILGFSVFISALWYAFARGSFLVRVLIATLLVGATFINSLFYPQIMFLWMTIISLDSRVLKLKT